MRATWTRLAVGIAFTAVCAVALSVSSTAQAPDPFVGTWKLDVAKSTYKPGPAPKSLDVAITAAADKTFKVAVDGVDPEGKPMKVGYTATRDGKDVPVTGSPVYDTAALTQTSPTEVTIVYKKGGKPAVTTKAAVAKDGKTMTVNSTGTDAKGQCVQQRCCLTRSSQPGNAHDDTLATIEATTVALRVHRAIVSHREPIAVGVFSVVLRLSRVRSDRAVAAPAASGSAASRAPTRDRQRGCRRPCVPAWRERWSRARSGR